MSQLVDCVAEILCGLGYQLEYIRLDQDHAGGRESYLCRAVGRSGTRLQSYEGGDHSPEEAALTVLSAVMAARTCHVLPLPDCRAPQPCPHAHEGSCTVRQAQHRALDVEGAVQPCRYRRFRLI